MQNYEKLGAFYLGKLVDPQASAPVDELLLYDSKDLTTHAVCVGMTGSGKTGLCLTLLEEAAIDGIPAIAIDPKGDLGNLLLTFPELQPANFKPWLDPSAAARAGQTPDEFASATAETWRRGLADWGQSPDRIARFRDAVDIAIYTPGSSAGLPLTVLRSLDAPGASILQDSDALRERTAAAAAGLLALLGIEADPVQSREYILIASLLEHVWKQGRSLDIAGLIQSIQAPPFERVGILDLETFFPTKDRQALAIRMNNLLASPSFANWLEGESLDVGRLLYTPAGKPRLSILSIAHLSDPERMFFVTILLNEVLTWVRSQPGTSSLRALLYMDEVFGFFPPTANPPSKTPMLTLLKQARAFGLGVVLATQNPVDLDYKGLSNAGTWFLGRLQTERDKARVLEGLEGASAASGQAFNRQQVEATLAGLGNRTFLLNNVHEDAPVLFQTRWVLSYLRGPLTRGQIETLMAPRKQAAIAEAKPTPTAAPALAASVAAPAAVSRRPALPRQIRQSFIEPAAEPAPDSKLLYRPVLLGQAKLHFSRTTYKVDVWQPRTLWMSMDGSLPRTLWDAAERVVGERLELATKLPAEGEFAELPTDLTQPDNYTGWEKKLKDRLYRTETVRVWKCAALKQYSEADESEGDFRVRLSREAHEQRDLAVEKLRARYGSRLATLQDRIRSAQAAVEREQSQFQNSAMQTAVSFGSSLLGALFGRKLASRTNVSKASTSVRSMSRSAQQHSDIARAQEKLDGYKADLVELEEKFEAEVDAAEEAHRVEALELEELSLRPKKTDITTTPVTLLWTPWSVNADAQAEPLFDASEFAVAAE